MSEARGWVNHLRRQVKWLWIAITFCIFLLFFEDYCRVSTLEIWYQALNRTLSNVYMQQEVANNMNLIMPACLKGKQETQSAQIRHRLLGR